MSFLDLFFLCSGIGIFLSAFRILKRESFLWWHFLLFLSVGVLLVTFTFLPEFRDAIGRVFGVERGADALVYVSVVLLFFLTFLILQQQEKQRQNITKMVREFAIKTAEKYEKK